MLVPAGLGPTLGPLWAAPGTFAGPPRAPLRAAPGSFAAGAGWWLAWEPSSQ